MIFTCGLDNCNMLTRALWPGLLILTSDVWSFLVLFLITIIALDFEHSYQYLQREVLILLVKGFVFSINSSRRKILLRIFCFSKRSSGHPCWVVDVRWWDGLVVSSVQCRCVAAEEPVVLRVKCVCYALRRTWVSAQLLLVIHQKIAHLDLRASRWNQLLCRLIYKWKKIPIFAVPTC